MGQGWFGLSSVHVSSWTQPVGLAMMPLSSGMAALLSEATETCLDILCTLSFSEAHVELLVHRNAWVLEAVLMVLTVSSVPAGLCHCPFVSVCVEPVTEELSSHVQ